MKERELFPDIARGLAMVMIIIWHTTNVHTQWTDSWTMPVFFVIMGLFYRNHGQFKELLVKKSKNILFPFFILSIPSYVQFAIQLSITDYSKRLADPFNCMHGVGWFLICMFWCYILYYWIDKFSKGNAGIKIFTTICISIFSFYISCSRFDILGGHRFIFPYFISTSLTCLPLITFGEVMRPYFFCSKRRSIPLLAISTISSGMVIGLFGCKSASLISNYFYEQPYWLWFLNSILGCTSILLMAKFLPRKIAFLGEHSLLILMLHPYVKRIVDFFTIPQYASFLIVTTITVPLVYVVAKYFPITEGKFK